MLKISQVTKSYGNLKANDNINLEIPEKSVALLVGPNGAGKSTLLKCIMGLLRYSGEIEISGLKNKSVEAKRIMGYVPEIPHMYPLLTISEHLEFTARAYKLDETWHERAENLLKRFELDDKKNKLGGTLSKGMQQKLSICVALLPEPNFILFDEPLIGLDPYAIKQLKSIFRELAESGHSLLISTHILDTVDELWDQVFIMDQGKVVASGRKSELDGLGKTLEEFFFDVTDNSLTDVKSNLDSISDPDIVFKSDVETGTGQK
ncbi:MAG: ABC transporter ATP-binding protein [Saccharofermentanales bacterium]